MSSPQLTEFAPTFGSLFSGIGGIDLGLERAGWRCIWQSEIDPYASRVLAKHWPDVPNLDDITTIDWSSVERPDLIAGGYPCQPFSFAGRRAGTDDPRHLWPWMRDALRLLRPRWALLENVPGHLGLGFADVLADLAALGFDVEWELLPAAAFGAPHLRYRLFVVADTDIAGLERRESAARRDMPARRGTTLVDTPRVGRRSGPGIFGGMGPTERSWWRSEPDVGRVAHGVPARVDRLRGLGNAVVPQVVEWIGKRILQAHTTCDTQL